jgi:hypothetical protein
MENHIAEIITGVIALCATLSTVLPPSDRPGVYATVRAVVFYIGMNFGHAGNVK